VGAIYGKMGIEEDRRSGTRHLSCFPAHIEVADGNPRTAIIRDVSVTGAHLVTRARLAEGDQVKLALYINTDTTRPRMVTGKVVRFESHVQDRTEWPYAVGVRFDEQLDDCETEIRMLADKQAKLFGTGR
jgi:hypothetical protein